MISCSKEPRLKGCSKAIKALQGRLFVALFDYSTILVSHAHLLSAEEGCLARLMCSPFLLSCDSGAAMKREKRRVKYPKNFQGLTEKAGWKEGRCNRRKIADRRLSTLWIKSSVARSRVKLLKDGREKSRSGCGCNLQGTYLCMELSKVGYYL